MFFARGDAQKKVTVTQIVIGKTGLFRSKKDCDAARSDGFANLFCSFFERVKFVLQFAVADGGSADYQSAVARGLCHRVVLAGFRQKRRGTDSGNRFTE